MSKDLEDIRDALRRFAADRDWDQFHSPKNLASAVVVEAAELLERFQWLTEDQSRALSAEENRRWQMRWRMCSFISSGLQTSSTWT